MYTAIAYNAKYMVEDAREQQVEISTGHRQKKNNSNKLSVTALIQKFFIKHTISHA